MRTFFKQSPRQSVGNDHGHFKGDASNAGNLDAGRGDQNPQSHIEPPFNETSTIIGINGKLLHGCLMGIVAYTIWPSDPKWWGLGMFSVILWVAAVAFVFEGWCSFTKLRAAKNRWAKIEGLGSSPKNARLADKSDLQQKGMN